MSDVRNLDLLEVVTSWSLLVLRILRLQLCPEKPQLLLDMPYHMFRQSLVFLPFRRRSECRKNSAPFYWCPSSPENSWDSSFLRVDKSALSYQQIATSGQRGGSAQRLETSGAGTCSSEEIYEYVLRARAVNSSGTATRHFGRISNSFFSHRVAQRPSRLRIPRLSLLVDFLPVNSNCTLCLTLT